MFAKYTLNYVFVWWNLSATTALQSSFQCFWPLPSFDFIMHWAVCFLTIWSTAIIQDFAYSICAKGCLLLITKSMFSSLNHLHNFRSSSSSSSSSSKTTALHATMLTAWLVLIVCFFSLAIIQELSHDCSRFKRRTSSPSRILKASVFKILIQALDVPWQDFAGIGSSVPKRKYKCELSSKTTNNERYRWTVERDFRFAWNQLPFQSSRVVLRTQVCRWCAWM